MHKRIISVFSVLLIGVTLLALNRSFRKLSVNKAAVKYAEQADSFMNGDLVFQTNTEGQGRAIQLATRSQYTHVGILFKVDGEWQVYEAVQPVQSIPLSEFTARGDSGKYTVLRLVKRDSLIGAGQTALMKSYLEQQTGKNYDPYFSWGDESMYCSELVWKCYKKAGISLSALRKLGSFHLSSDLVQKTLKQRYGAKIPYNEQVVAPEDIYRSNLLKVVRAYH